ncbi:hypothetical protein RHSIM_Rhsim01G0082400 [Rhododendron simsii]|uniref:Reverse transcriptase/retrotransposon-derived protein RNase H-like domain-containing protein n=1 Tax=Rhododendron simsii TaxID=118357 RepID=A0A834LYR4_RHOSS|nr:hypothetical protein RHSIM_Rhsim01G0082400 [Rhododendron simsii]
MLHWPQPQTIKALRGFLGLIGYYRRFIRDYGKICQPLNLLLKRDAFGWSEEAESAFHQLKTALSSALVLTLADYTKPFVLECDASGKGVGAILMQERRPLAFYSKALSITRLGLFTYEKKLFAVVMSIMQVQWEGILEGKLRTYQRLKQAFFWKGMKQAVLQYVALYGQKPPNLMHYISGCTTVAVADNMLQDRSTILKLLKEHLVSSQHRMKQIVDQHRSERVFEVGDWVYLKLQPFRQVTVAFRRNAKLAPKYFGPYQVVKKVRLVAYELELPPYSKIHLVFHVSLLKKKLGQDAVVQTELPLVREVGQMQLEPVAILDRRLVKQHNRPVTKVWIQWSNSILEDATWESTWHDIQQHFPLFQP